MKVKIKKWINRYLPAEISGAIGAVFGGIIVNTVFHNPVLTALGGTWGENVGYYSVIIYRDIRRSKEKNREVNSYVLLKIFRNLIFEFGPGEFLDSFIVRPLSMYIFPKILNNLFIGLIVGKFAADFVFYIPTIISYELRDKLLKE